MLIDARGGPVNSVDVYPRHSALLTDEFGKRNSNGKNVLNNGNSLNFLPCTASYLACFQVTP